MSVRFNRQAALDRIWRGNFIEPGKKRLLRTTASNAAIYVFVAPRHLFFFLKRSRRSRIRCATFCLAKLDRRNLCNWDKSPGMGRSGLAALDMWLRFGIEGYVLESMSNFGEERAEVAFLL